MPETTLEPRAHQEAQASLGTILRIAGVGIALDLAIAYQQPGIAIPIFFVIAAALLRRSFRRGWQDDALLALAVLVSAFCALRASEPLIALDVLVALGLFVAAAASTPGSALRASMLDSLRLAERIFRAVLVAPAFVVRPIARAYGDADMGRAKRVARAALIATPILALFAALLASADEVFGRLLTPAVPNVDGAVVATHMSLVVLGALAAATIWCVGSLRDAESVVDEVSAPARSRGAFAEWVTVLGGIDALFVVFVGVQLSVLFGGRHRVEVTPGLTYAEYARSGFFQLIAVASLTVVVLVAAWDLGARADRRARLVFGWLVGIMVGCTLVILASAWMRLRLYEDAFGATMARLAAGFGIVFIAFVLVVLPIVMVAGARRHFVSTVLAGAVGLLLVFNALNPDASIARRNVGRFRASDKIDVPYLTSALGDDAVPAMVDLLDHLDERRASALRGELCARAHRLGDAEPSARSYNAGRAAARRALRDLARSCPAQPDPIPLVRL